MFILRVTFGQSNALRCAMRQCNCMGMCVKLRARSGILRFANGGNVCVHRRLQLQSVLSFYSNYFGRDFRNWRICYA